MKTLWVVVAVHLLFAPRLFAQPLVPLPDSGSSTFGDWSFSWEKGTANSEGLVLRNVNWKGTKVLHKASLPVIRVKYRGNASDIEAGCGPYSDRIGSFSHLNGQTTDVVARFFGNNLMEIAVFAEIGGYDLYQAFYFHRSGRFEAILYSSGWSCHDNRGENDHKHHPYWRFDFDIGGIPNRARHAMTVSGGGMSQAMYSPESGFTVPSNATGIVWTVANSATGRHVRISAPSNERADPPGASPWFGFGRRDVHVRRYHSGEDEGWAFNETDQLGYFTPAEVTEDQDVVFWSIGHLTHVWSQADQDNPHWHSTGWIVDVTW